MLTDWQKLDNLFNALADDIMEMSDEEIRQEMIEDGEDPDEIAAHMKEMVERIIIEKGPDR